MIKCKICGHEVKYRLIEHIIKTHNMTIDNYKRDYGEVVSEEYKNKVSEKSKEKWKDIEYRNKTLKSKEWIYSDKKLNKKRIESIKNYYKNGGKVWNDGLTKNENDSLKSIGEKNKKNLTGRTKEKYEYLNKHSKLMKSLWENSNIKQKWEDIQNNEKLKTKWKNKISETISNKIINGKINTMSSFNCGWYKNENGKFWYSSELEKNTMILFDKLKINWKNSKEKIKYQDCNGNYHYYIPDFNIEIDNVEIVIEMKGFDWDGLTEIKANEATKLYNYRLFYSIDELKKYLKYEINKNKIN